MSTNLNQHNHTQDSRCDPPSLLPESCILYVVLHSFNKTLPLNVVQTLNCICQCNITENLVYLYINIISSRQGWNDGVLLLYLEKHNVRIFLHVFLCLKGINVFPKLCNKKNFPLTSLTKFYQNMVLWLMNIVTAKMSMGPKCPLLRTDKET